MDQDYVCSITPTEFERYCKEILLGYAEEEKLPQFLITHDAKIAAYDGTYQIDIYAEFTAMSVTFKVLCECKQYSKPVGRDKVAELHGKLESIGANKGILLATSGFQSGAIEYAKAHGIALIQVYDSSCEYLSHSAGPTQEDEDDPFLYMERQRPPYSAIDCTADSEYPVRIYPTGKMIRKIYLESQKVIEERWGIKVDFPELEEDD